MPVHYSQRIFPLTLWTAEALASGETLESAIINCTSRVPDILLFKVVGASGTGSVKIEYAISNDGVNFNEYDSQDPIITASATEFASKNEEDYHAINCPSAPFIQILVTELASLASVVDVTLWMREL